MQKLSTKKLENLTQITNYRCDFDVVCNGQTVHVNAITVVENDDGTNTATVEHDSEADIYADSAFEAAISQRIGAEVRFAGKTLQDSYTAVMHYYY